MLRSRYTDGAALHGLSGRFRDPTGVESVTGSRWSEVTSRRGSLPLQIRLEQWVDIPVEDTVHVTDLNP